MVTENIIDLVVVGSLHGDYNDQSQSANYLPYCLARPSSVETLKQSSTASPDYARRNYVVSDSHSHGRIAAPKHKVQTRPNEVMHTVHIPRPISIAHDLVRQLLSHSSHRLHVLSHFENTPSPACLHHTTRYCICGYVPVSRWRCMLVGDVTVRKFVLVQVPGRGFIMRFGLSSHGAWLAL